MTNQEKKHKKWNELLPKYKHLENYCIIEAKGLDDDSPYFHPTFTISNDVYVTSQSDVGHNFIYATKFIINNGNYYSVDIPEELLPYIIIGYTTNKDVVMLALTTLGNIRNHTNQIDMYAYEYINHLLIGNSIKDVTQKIINELDVTNKAIEFLQKQPKKD
jgi:hypothetical protein